MATKQQKYYLKNREIIIAKLKEKRKAIKENITVTIHEDQPVVTESEPQSKHIIPDEKKYIDALRSMLIPQHKFVSLIPCDEDDRGRPIFFYINRFPDEDSTEISIVKIRYIKCGPVRYEPDWDIVEEISNIHDRDLHNIMAFDPNRAYEGCESYLSWKGKFLHLLLKK